MFNAKILKDSINKFGIRLISMEITFPRFILAEVNTHRVFSRNSASSRAIPIEKMIEKVQTNPFYPIYWGKNQKGMQAKQELNDEEIALAKYEWQHAINEAILRVKNLSKIGVHKQTANRLLEPFLWHTAIISSTEWENWDSLRDHKDAQPEIKMMAQIMKECRSKSSPKLLQPGDWHLPLVRENELEEIESIYGAMGAPMISSGRCCRVSYLTHNGERNLKADLDLCNTLVKDGHMSPMEHPAMCTEEQNFIGNFKSWKQYRKMLPNESVFSNNEIEIKI